MKITKHAKDRLTERFPALKGKISQLIKDAVPYGRAKGNERFLLNNDHKVVFVIRKNLKTNKEAVTTVLTLAQCIANFGKFNRKINLSDFNAWEKQIQKPQKVQQPQSRPISKMTFEEKLEIIKKQAKEFVETNKGNFPVKKERKKLNAEINNKFKIGVSYFWNFVAEYNFEYHNNERAMRYKTH